MKQVINIVKLLSMISQTKKDADKLYTDFIDESTFLNKGKFVTIYKDITKCTNSGMDISDATNAINYVNSTIINTPKILYKLLSIKHDINEQCSIQIPKLDEDDIEITVNINTALMISSKRNRNYSIGYLDRLISDYEKACNLLEQNQKSALSQDKIDIYVRAKLNSLNLSPNNSDENLYKKFSNEYIDSNKCKILDPLDVANTVRDFRKKLIDKYDTIDARIKSFNATTKIWIDLDIDSTNFWGYY